MGAQMQRVGRLDFPRKRHRPTMFAELHSMQKAFSKMEQGLAAFAKTVPPGPLRCGPPHFC